VFTPKETSKSSGQRRSFITGQVRFHNRGTHWRRQRCCLFIGQRTTNRRLGDFGDLISIHEPQAVRSFDRDAIEEVEFRQLKYVMNRTELLTAGREHGRSHLQRQIRNRFSVIQGSALALSTYLSVER
jgi:hypothetical protein